MAGGDVPEQVTAITAATGGDAFQSGDVEGFNAIFRRIDQMRPAKIELVESEKIDNFQPWAYSALGVMGVWVLSLFGLRFTPW